MAIDIIIFIFFCSDREADVLHGDSLGPVCQIKSSSGEETIHIKKDAHVADEDADEDAHHVILRCGGVPQ